MKGYPYIFGTIAFTVYGQLILKWRMNIKGELPQAWGAKAAFAAHLLADPWVLSGLVAAFLAFISWIGALGSFDLTYAYPFTSLSFVVVLALGVVIFGESLTAGKAIAVILICSGLIVGSKWS